MSDSPQGDGWWRANNGKWYPPEQHANYQPLAARAPTAEATLTDARAGGAGRRTIAIVAAAVAALGLSWFVVASVFGSADSSEPGTTFAGELRWSREILPTASRPVLIGVDDTRMIFADDCSNCDRRFVAVDPATGDELWQTVMARLNGTEWKMLGSSMDGS